MRLLFSRIRTSRSFICSKYSIRIKVDILLPDNLFAAGNCDTFLHIFVSKQFRAKPERYTFFLIDDKCECNSPFLGGGWGRQLGLRPWWATVLGRGRRQGQEEGGVEEEGG